MSKVILFFLSVMSIMACNPAQKNNKQSTQENFMGKSLDSVLHTNRQGDATKRNSDENLFAKLLKCEGVEFSVLAMITDGKSSVKVTTTGLEIIEYSEILELDGHRVVNAEVAELNADDSPELLIYTQSDGSGSYGNVLVFSVNNRKSMSQVYFSPVVDNKAINKGYMGHDKFSIENNTLVHRFPIYKDSDSNSNPTGGIRQVTYKMVDGEGTRRLEVASVSVKQL